MRGEHTPPPVDYDARIADIEGRISELNAQLRPLLVERDRLLSEQIRREYPDGPFRLVVWRHHVRYEDEYDEPISALRAADSIEDDGSGSTEAILDRHGAVIYDLDSYPWKRVADGYPEVPDDL